MGNPLAGYVGSFKLYSDITASGTSDFILNQSDYQISDIGGFFNWTLDVGADVVDTTNFDSTGWRTFTPVLKNWTGTAERHWISASSDHMVDWLGKRMICRFYMSDGYYWTGLGYVTGVSPSVGTDTLVNEALTFQGVDQLWSDISEIDSDA